MKAPTMPQLTDAMMHGSYWPSEHVIAQPIDIPEGVYKNVRDPILDIFNVTKHRNTMPIHLQYGEILPRIGMRRGMLKLVIDELQSTYVTGLMRPFVRPALSGGKRLKSEQFNVVAKKMFEDPWYNGRHIQHIVREGSDVTHQLTRRVAYVVPVEREGGWFIGVKAASMHGHSDSFVPAFTMLRDHEEETFAFAVGDIATHLPEDNAMHMYLKDHLKVRLLSKVSAAFLHLV